MARRNNRRNAARAATAANQRHPEDVQYKECLRNFSREEGKFVFDGCYVFSRRGDGPEEALICVACGCHRDHHRNEEVRPTEEQAVAMRMREEQIRRGRENPNRVEVENGEDAPQAVTDDDEK